MRISSTVSLRQKNILTLNRKWLTNDAFTFHRLVKSVLLRYRIGFFRAFSGDQIKPIFEENKMKPCKLLALCLLVVAFCTASGTAQMKFYHINLGQGEAMLLEFKRAAVLIDAGGSTVEGDRYRQHHTDYLDSFFENRRDLRITLYSFIVTHPHIDHMSFVMDVFRNYRERNFVNNGDLFNF